MPKTEERRRRVMEEIVDTEASFLAQLGVLISLYKKPMLAQVSAGSSNHITSEIVDRIFGKVESLELLSKQMLQDLKDRLASGTGFGKLFIDFAPYFRLYSDYLNGYDAALSALIGLKSRPEFVHFLDQQSAKPECTLNTIENYLILPVQRVPRYKMLLESLLQSTIESHSEYKVVEQALQITADVATKINADMSRFQDVAKVSEVASRFETRLDTYGRTRLVMEANLPIATAAGLQNVVFFLFGHPKGAKKEKEDDDGGLLVTAEKIGGLFGADRLKTLHKLELWDMEVDVADTWAHHPYLASYQDKGYVYNAKISHSDERAAGGKAEFVVLFASQADKTKWVNAFKEQGPQDAKVARKRAAFKRSNGQLTSRRGIINKLNGDRDRRASQTSPYQDIIKNAIASKTGGYNSGPAMPGQRAPAPMAAPPPPPGPVHHSSVKYKSASLPVHDRPPPPSQRRTSLANKGHTTPSHLAPSKPMLSTSIPETAAPPLPAKKKPAKKEATPMLSVPPLPSKERPISNGPPAPKRGTSSSVTKPAPPGQIPSLPGNRPRMFNTGGANLKRGPPANAPSPSNLKGGPPANVPIPVPSLPTRKQGKPSMPSKQDQSQPPPPGLPPTPTKGGSSNVEGSGKTYPYEELCNPCGIAGVDNGKREQYLSDADFSSVLGMERDSFAKLPKWKQSDIKKKKRLF